MFVDNSVKVNQPKIDNSSDTDALTVLQKAFTTEKRHTRDVYDELRVKTETNNLLITQTLASFDVMSTGVETNVGHIVDVIRAQTAELKNVLGEIETSGISGDTKVHTDCADLLRAGYTTSGEYRIRPANMWRPVLVFCDMETDGGGWTVMQRRVDGSENFQRKWRDYAVGFGNVSREFWLGNEFVHRITKGIPQELRFDLEDYDGERRYAVYGQFSLGPSDDLYRLNAEYYN